MNELARTALIILGLAALGIFGNVNIIVATIRKKNLRCKAGILIGFLAVADLICLLFECSIAGRMLSGVSLSKKGCFEAVVGYYIVQFVSAAMLIGLAVDRFMAVVFPIWYLSHHVGYTLTFSVILGLTTSGSFSVVGGLIIVDDGALNPICFPGDVLPDSIQWISSWCLFLMNVAVVIIYVAAYVSLHIQKRRAQTQKNSPFRENLQSNEKAMRSITVFLALFLSTWLLAQFDMAVLPMLCPVSVQPCALEVLKATQPMEERKGASIQNFMRLTVSKECRVGNQKSSPLRANLQKSEKAMKSISVFLTVFLATWFIAQFEVTVISALFDADTNNFFVNALRSTKPFTVLISFSQCYYVYFWRSKDHRTAFLEQLGYDKWPKMKIRVGRTSTAF
ncbi:hypothetical protein QR680_006363 [Steinernema hermaphroditum]|uniref:G-protein coupled receptors family 1 profile domain-containing protein n=1 Tax=Steinernema hermaphroditum TaxID=289476 RepID=A0AA39HV66_9BILA|nr:hypothetical protein QR680_006363 [Steinernema hermaphroditum]